MGLPPLRTLFGKPSHLFTCGIPFSLFILTLLLIYKVDNLLSQTGTVVGHNLQPTPWHPFPPKTFNEQNRYARASKIIQCSYLTCSYASPAYTDSTAIDEAQAHRTRFSESTEICPDFFRSIQRDLQPWAGSGISLSHLAEAKSFAAFRVVIVDGKLYVDFYYACVQSRAMFTVWGLLQLLRRYPGLVPDVDLMFDCMDKPNINRTEHSSKPLPLFRYCTTKDHYDIPFPDWSFWGWPETNLHSWGKEFQDIKEGSHALSWNKRFGWAYWKGNPYVSSAVRTELLKCNHSRKWGAQIMTQDWVEESKAGYEQSKLSKQCKHRYKIYAEGYAWSVSLKYILSCGSLALIISSQYEDFFSRGLISKKNYWPVSSNDICPSIKLAVDWANANSLEAEAIGRSGQEFMESLSMDRIYDYMYHLISGYSKLMDFEPVPPASAREICLESILCFADEKQRKFLEESTAFPILERAPCKFNA